VSQKPLSRRERGWGEGIKRSDRAWLMNPSTLTI